MAKIHYERGAIDQTPIVENIARILTDSVKEGSGWLLRSDNDDSWELHFQYSYAWFKLYNISGDYFSDSVTFTVEMILRGERIWYDYVRDFTVDAVASRFKGHVAAGFDTNTGHMFWGANACARQEFILHDDVLEGVEDDPFDDTDDQSVFDSMQFCQCQHVVDAETGVDDSSEESIEVPSKRFDSQINRVYPSIVPADLRSVRVVALKYNGQIIAYRFKTDKGAFDMRRDTAETKGLGGFKTETFISLKSVNGLLMSESEQKRKSLIPDVSDCQEDCERLINAVFSA